MSDFLETRGEIAAFLGWSWRKVMQMRARSGLPVRKVGGRWMASKEALANWLRDKTRAAA